MKSILQDQFESMIINQEEKANPSIAQYYMDFCKLEQNLNDGHVGSNFLFNSKKITSTPNYDSSSSVCKNFYK